MKCGGRGCHTDSISVVLLTDQGQSSVEATVLLNDSPRLLSVDGIQVEAPLEGHLVFMKNWDLPGVIGRAGTILGENKIKSQIFPLRGAKTTPRRAIPRKRWRWFTWMRLSRSPSWSNYAAR